MSLLPLSGKSNILDAISFVMGVRSSQLRGQALTDLIYKPTALEQEEEEGKEGREEERKEQLQREAYVELVYSLSDDELHAFPSLARPVLRFRRSILRSGSSQYRFNEAAVRWEEYSAQLEKLGVSVKAKNFLVFQGDVEAIAQRSGRQMAELIESISGSGALQPECEAAAEAKAAVDEETVRVWERLLAMKKERSQLRKQKEEAEEWTRLQQQARQAKSELFLWSFFHLCEDVRQLDEQKADAAQRLEEKTERKAELEQAVRELQQELGRRKRLLSEAEKALTERSRRLERKRPEHIRLKEEVKHLRQKVAAQEKELDDWLSRRKAQRRELQRLEDDLRRVREEIQQVQAAEEEEEGRQQEVQLAAADQREYAELKKQLNTAVSELQQRKRSLLSLIERQQAAVERQLDLMREMQERRRKEEDNRRELSKKTDRLEQAVQDISARLEANRKRRAEGERKGRAAQATRQKLSDELSAVVGRLEEASVRVRDSHRQQKQADLVDALRRLFPAVRGSLISLVKPSAKKYELPAVIALGRHSDSIVVDTERAALDCVAYMKEQKLGVATFIPLDTVRVRPVSEAARQLGGSARLVLDVLQFSDDVQRALLYAVGSTVVCDRLDEAQRLKFGDAAAGGGGLQLKIVTVDGSVIHKGGNMTGGVGRAHADVGRFEEKQQEADRGRKDELMRRLAELDAARLDEEQRELDAAISKDEVSLRFLEADLATHVAQARRKEAEMKELEERLTQLQPEVEAKQEEERKRAEELQAVDGRIAREEQRVFAAFNRRIGVASIREYEDGRLKAVEEYSRRKAELSKQETALLSALEYERGREEGEVTERKLRGRLDSNRKKLEDAAAKEEKKGEEIDREKEELLESGEAVKDSSRQAEEKERELRDRQRELSLCTEEVAMLEKQLAAVAGSLELVREEMREIMKTARVENVPLPKLKKRGRQQAAERRPSSKRRGGRRAAQADEEELADGDEAAEEEERDGEEEEEGRDEDADVEMLTEEEQALMMESGDPCATLDFSRLRANRDTRSPAEREEARQSYLQLVSELVAAAEKLAPNLKAVDKYEEASERVEQTVAELKERKEAQAEAERALAEVTERRKRLFLGCFEHLRSSIAAIYQSLTASADLPMGGKAMLLLEGDEGEERPYESGVIYRVMPPMKRYMPMDALSGGEKTVASLALIFALHSFRPAPFFILDEIDAALDNINVQRVANYVRLRAVREQLQVVVISLKETLYSKANSLIGVYRDSDSKSSAALTLDLSKYD